MFTGIVTDIGTIRSAEQHGDLRLVIGCATPMEEVGLGASIACAGTCLTVVAKGPDWFAVELSAETVARTAPGRWIKGARINLERALKVGDELGGHIVTGHIDGVGTVLSLRPEGDSRRIDIRAPGDLAAALAPKGSVTIDGVSLTVNEVADQPDGSVHFSINLIAHTWNVTTLGDLAEGQAVNLEIDILARYLQRMQMRAM